ncbi:mechanosensitive ion channel family protein [Agrobacterium radiobacter]|uniref:mechanosensitive ion channel family protein n=1 Tax=Agrobacterium radiobacter TaxID=362 RepID=UPI000DD08BB1
MATSVSIIVLNLLGVAGIVIWHIQGRSRPTERLVTQIAFFLVMTGTLVFTNVSPFRFNASEIDSHTTLIVSAKILWWTHMAWATIGFVRLYIVLDGMPREARLIQDLLVAMTYLGVLLSVMAFVFGVPIGTLLATSGIVAIILGLALQNTLGDVFSGIALTLGRPYVLGDWILLSDGVEGRVVASNWRSTYILTYAHNVVVLPNSVLAKQGLTNISKPDENHLITLPLRIIPTKRPRFAVDALRQALSNCNSIIQQPPPIVAVVGMNGAALEMELHFRVPGPLQRGIARNEVIDLVYQHCLANGLTLAKPIGSQIFESLPTSQRTASEKLFDSAPLLEGLTDHERSTLVASAKLKEVNAGVTLTSKGQVAKSFLLINSGIVSLNDDSEEIVRLAPGDYLGARSMITGEPEVHEAKATTLTTFYEIEKSDFENLLSNRTFLVDDINRRLTQARVPQRNGEEPVVSPQVKADLIRTIRSAFGSL